VSVDQLRSTEKGEDDREGEVCDVENPVNPDYAWIESAFSFLHTTPKFDLRDGARLR
jgi:hypothetical protein